MYAFMNKICLSLFILFIAAITICGTAEDARTGDNLTSRVKTFMDRREYEKAEELLEQQLDKTPENAELLFLLASCARAQNDIQKAGDVLKKALEIDPDLYKARFNLALLRSLPGRPHYDLPQAIKDLEQLLQDKPDFLMAWYHLGSYCRRHQEYEKAEKYLNEAKDKLPGDWRVYKDLYLLYIEQSRFEKAEEIMNKAKTRFPEDADWDKIRLDKLMRRAKRRMLDFRYEEAKPLLDKIQNLYPENSEATFLRAFIAHEQGSKEKASELYRTLFDNEEYSDRAILNLARMYALEGENLEEADALLSKLQKKIVMPSWETQAIWMIIHAREGDIQAAKNNREIASRCLEFSTELEKMDPEKHELPQDYKAAVAFLEWKKGNPEKARKWLKDLEPNQNTILYRFISRLNKDLGAIHKD